MARCVGHAHIPSDDQELAVHLQVFMDWGPFDTSSVMCIHLFDWNSIF